MMKNTTDNSPTRHARARFWAVAIGIAVVVNAVILFGVLPFMRSDQTIDPTEQEQRAAEIREQAARLEEQRRLAREKTHLDPEVAEKVRQLEEQKRLPKIEKRVERLAEIEKELQERSEEAIRKLAEQTPEKRRELKKEKVLDAVRTLETKVNNVLETSVGRLVFGGTTSDTGNYPKQLDELRIYRQVLTADQLSDPRNLPTAGLTHHWPVEESDQFTLSNKAGDIMLKLPRKLNISPAATEAAASASAVDFTSDKGLLDVGRFGLGEQLTISFWVYPRRAQDQTWVSSRGRDAKSEGIQLGTRLLEDGKSMQLELISRGKAQNGRIHSGSAAASVKAWSHVAVTLNTATDEAELYLNGERVTVADTELPDLAGDLNTEVGGADPALAEKLQEVKDAVEDLPTEETAGEEAVEAVADAAQELTDLLTEQKENGVSGRPIDLARLAAKAVAEEAEDYAESADEPGADPTVIADYNPPTSEPSAPGSDPESLYQQATELEQKIEDAFTRGRAAEIAATSDVSAEEALEAAKAQTAERPGLGQALADSKAGNAVADIDSHRAGMKKIQDELDAMVSRAEAMRRQAPGATPAGDTQMSSLAHQGATTHRPGEMVDMTQLTAMLSAGGVGMGGGSGGDGGAGSYRVAPQGSGAEFDLGPESVSIGRGEPFPILPGRRITDDALRHSWLFVGTWYVIGPWEAGNRFNFDVRRPPEVAIDLDARYFDGKFAKESGHIDQVLSWRFYQSDRRRCEPPRVYANATYYWFTEVYSDRDRSVIFAIGKDDGGRVWLNDVLIYENKGYSSDTTRGLFDEIKGLRKVTLKKGYNKILVRHENGPAFAHQRLIIMSDDAVTLSQK